MTGAFQTNGFWLLLSDEDVDLEWADGPGTDEEFDRRLTGSGRLPDLAGAPVASWVVARLARLVGRLPAWACEQQGDEGAYCLAFLVFDHDRSHLGGIEVVGNRAGVAAYCECPEAASVLSELAATLLAEPTAVAECRVEVREAEDEAECELQGLDPDTQVQAIYGYERAEYLGAGNLSF